MPSNTSCGVELGGPPEAALAACKHNVVIKVTVVK
jgi:hypothetical protein